LLLLYFLPTTREDRLPPRRNVDEEELQSCADAAVIDAVDDAIMYTCYQIC